MNYVVIDIYILIICDFTLFSRFQQYNIDNPLYNIEEAETAYE